MNVYRIRRPEGRAGFTLVELLIVVAIIGVLATMGVPAYKRMVERSKTKEAQVALGGIYTAQIAFQSEYGGYFSNLIGGGFEFEGSGTNYIVGFPNDASCGTAAALPTDGLAGQPGEQIRNSYPQYYDGKVCSVAGRGVVAPAGNGNCTTPASTSCGFAAFPANSGAYFIATASGCIASGCKANSEVQSPAGIVTDENAGNVGDFTAPAASATANKRDVWAINQRRKLLRVQAGGSGA